VPTAGIARHCARRADEAVSIDDVDQEMITRRQLLHSSTAAALLGAVSPLLPRWVFAGSHTAPTATEFDLEIGKATLPLGGRTAKATAINGTLPGPLLRMREGDTVTLRVRNRLREDTSLHWHGILLPPEMDGVPGISFDGIPPGDTFEYRYQLQQNGTYWYHSHSGFQEQEGVYGPLIVESAEPEPFAYDREHVVLLSDWTFEDTDRLYARLKKHSDYYNQNRLTLSDLFRDAEKRGFGEAMATRAAWKRMRMDPTDIADITGSTYTFLLNGHDPVANWTGLFQPGERVRLRVINGSAMSYFDVRIPGLAMTVVQADGQHVKPVTVDELQIAVAETFDVIVEPAADRAYTIVAESMDRSGMARGTLAPRAGMNAAVPELRPRPLRTMKDMGMGDMAGHEHHMHGGKPKFSGAAVANEAMMPTSRLHEPGTGLGDVEHRVLTYKDLNAAEPFYDQRPPEREVELHLTGNMERYMWSFDGKKYSEVKEPIRFTHGERVRLTFINDTMMEHPIHLHGMWMEVVTGTEGVKPRKHTISVKPGERLSVDVSADAVGAWAFHCHLLYHMKAGMFREVRVEARPTEA
jgi:FtsP/CotA-like multicopper oxidase with cupredoxin domain